MLRPTEHCFNVEGEPWFIDWTELPDPLPEGRVARAIFMASLKSGDRYVSEEQRLTARTDESILVQLTVPAAIFRNTHRHEDVEFFGVSIYATQT